MYLQWKSIARSCKCTALRKIMYFTWIRARNFLATSAPLESLQQFCSITVVFQVVFQCVSWRSTSERCSLDHPFELSVSACQHPSFELLPASLVLRISHNTLRFFCTLWQYDNDLFWDFSSFSCRSFFKFFQDPLHHNCHSVKIRSS